MPVGPVIMSVIHASGAAKRKRKSDVESKIEKLAKVTSFFTQQPKNEVKLKEPTELSEVSGLSAQSAGFSSSEVNMSRNVQPVEPELHDYEHSETDAATVVPNEAKVSHGDDAGDDDVIDLSISCD